MHKYFCTNKFGVRVARKKSTKKAKRERASKTGVSKGGTKIQGWIQVHKFEQSSCDVKRLQPPDDDWRARKRTEDGVQVIFDSMTQFGNLTGNIWAVATSRLFYVAAKALRDDPTNEKLQATYNEHLRTVVLQVVSGDHTTAAYQRKNHMYPHAECWQTVQFQLLICEGTPEDFKFLYEFGIMMNLM